MGRGAFDVGLVVPNGGLGFKHGGTGWCRVVQRSSLEVVELVGFVWREDNTF